MKIYINPYKTGSKSVKELSKGLNEQGIETKILRVKNSRYAHDPINHLVVNWGSSEHKPYEYDIMPNVLNPAHSVGIAANKVFTFKALNEHDVRGVPSFFSKEDAAKFLEAKEGRVVYCRTLVSASQGKGIVVAHNVGELVEAKLYTGGLLDKGRKEFRVHVFKGNVLHVQQKRKRNGYKKNDDFSDEVRNLEHGWIFGINDVKIADETKATCVSAVRALGLDFGAVDILQTPNGKGWVLEVNTACGLEGTTIAKYVEAIKNYAEPPKPVAPQLVRNPLFAGQVLAVDDIDYDEEEDYDDE